MNEEFHKPFIKSLLIIAMVTLFAMVSSHYLVDYYYNLYKNNIDYTSAPLENPKK